VSSCLKKRKKFKRNSEEKKTRSTVEKERQREISTVITLQV
jgi:hypothetical protein